MSTARWLLTCGAAVTFAATLGFAAGAWWAGRRAESAGVGEPRAEDAAGVPASLRGVLADARHGLVLARIDRFDRLAALHGDDAAGHLRERFAGLLESGGGRAVRAADDTLALLPDGDAAAAADRARDAIRTHRFRLPDGAEVLATAALGGTARGAGDTPAVLWARAAAALAASADRGRNRVGWAAGDGTVAVR